MSAARDSRPTPRAPVPLFSPRLNEMLEEMEQGRAPNSGRFCGYCYTPVARDRALCPHCGASTNDWPPTTSVPPEVFDMFDRMRRREGYVVHSFAYVGLLLAFLASFALFYSLPEWPWLLLDLALLVALTLTLPRLTGGWIGDELGAFWAQRRLAQDWRAFNERRLSQRDAAECGPLREPRRR